MKIDITDEATRECLAVFIIVHRLGFDAKTEIGLMVNDWGKMAVAVKRNKVVFAMQVGTTLMPTKKAHAEWDDWAKNICLGEVDTAAIEDFLQTTKVYKHAIEQITRGLMSKGMIDVATLAASFTKPANEEQTK